MRSSGQLNRASAIDTRPKLIRFDRLNDATQMEDQNVTTDGKRLDIILTISYWCNEGHGMNLPWNEGFSVPDALDSLLAQHHASDWAHWRYFLWKEYSFNNITRKGKKITKFQSTS